MPYLLLDRFRNLFEGHRYRHRDSSLGDSVALRLPEDLYNLNRSPKFKMGVDTKHRVLNIQNQLQGINFRRGDGTFGEIVPHATAVDVPPFVVARAPIATVEIGTEVKILANSMIKQIDRVMNDLQRQAEEFKKAGGTPIAVGIVGINQADRYTSYERETEYKTGINGKKHPIQEAVEAEKRVIARVSPAFDELLILRFRARNEPPYPFEWVDEVGTEADYGAALVRIIRKYEARF